MNFPSADEAAEIIRRGEAAAVLMDSDTFNDVVADLSTYHLAAMSSAKPGPEEREAREYHHLIHYALREILLDLKGRAEAGAALKARLNSPDEDD